MLNNPQVGDVIRFNSEGLQSVYGTSMGLSHMKTLDLKIVEVGVHVPCDDADIWSIAVNDSEINQFVLTSFMFDHSPNCERIKDQDREGCPKCDGKLRPKSGGGVACSKCSYWFCY